MRPLPRAALGVVLLIFPVGCSTAANAPIAPPSYDPAAMADAAVSEFDRNGNGVLEGAELDACPALKAALAAVDADRNRKFSRDELKARFEEYRKLDAGAVNVRCEVTLNGAPLGGATITFTPEACMLGAVGPAEATTHDDGSVLDFRVDGRGEPGLPCGLYRITVSKKDAAGNELVPVRYRDTLGCEIFDAGRGGGAPVILKLTR